MASTQKDVLDAVQSEIDGLSLAGMERVAVRSAPSDNGQFYPGITIHPTKETESLGTNEQDDIGYGVQVTMVINNDNNLDENDFIGTWRQTIRKKFIHQKLSGVSNVCTITWEPGPMYTPNRKSQQISTFILRVTVRESRS